MNEESSSVVIFFIFIAVVGGITGWLIADHFKNDPPEPTHTELLEAIERGCGE